MRFDMQFLCVYLRAALPTLGVALFGLLALGWLMLTSRPADAGGREGQIGVLIAPWSQGGMAAAAGFDLPIIALRWGGHLVVLDVSSQPDMRQQLLGAGYIVINTAVPTGCLMLGNAGV